MLINASGACYVHLRYSRSVNRFVVGPMSRVKIYNKYYLRPIPLAYCHICVVLPYNLCCSIIGYRTTIVKAQLKMLFPRRKYLYLYFHQSLYVLYIYFDRCFAKIHGYYVLMRYDNSSLRLNFRKTD